jgi:L-rhamnose-H+ transport protein
MDTMVGIGWTIVGAIFLGTFALPSKYVKNFAWENTWGAFFLFAMLVAPVAFACATVNGLWAGYANIPGSVIFWVVALGFLWGCGFCCWGYGLSMVGLSLGYALTMGTMALVGSIVPFFLGNAAMATTLPGMVVIGGILICICGVGLNGFAGVQREKSEGGDAGEKKVNMGVGVLVCVTAGVLSSGLNIAFHIGGEIATVSGAEFGNPDWLKGMAVWNLIFLGGFLSSVSFSVFMLCKNKTWGGFKNVGSAKNIMLAFIMAVGHFLCIFFYGVGSWKLGPLGTSVGFAIFQSGALLLGIGLGFLTGEWKDASAKSKQWMFIGLATLIGGVIIVSIGNALN